MGVPLPLQGVPRRRPPAASVFSLITPRLPPSSLTASTPPLRTWRQLHCAASPIPGNWPPSIQSNHGRCEPSRVWSGPIWRGSSNGRKKDVVISDEPGHPPPCSGQADSLTCESMLACRRRGAQVCGQACMGLPPARLLHTWRRCDNGEAAGRIGSRGLLRTFSHKSPTHRWLVAQVGTGRYHACRGGI